MPPKESISLMSFASIRTLIVSSESLAVKYKPSLFNSNLIPFKTGITFLVDIALITLFNPVNNVCNSYFISIYGTILRF